MNPSNPHSPDDGTGTVALTNSFAGWSACVKDVASANRSSKCTNARSSVLSRCVGACLGPNAAQPWHEATTSAKYASRAEQRSIMKSGSFVLNIFLGGNLTSEAACPYFLTRASLNASNSLYRLYEDHRTGRAISSPGKTSLVSHRNSNSTWPFVLIRGLVTAKAERVIWEEGGIWPWSSSSKEFRPF